jgi:mediator of RNA polymerase II transcription subunit 18
MDFRQIAQFIVEGDHFVQDNVVVRIMRAYAMKQTSAEDPLSLLPTPNANIQALDTSGAYVVEASIRATDESSSELREKAKKELLGFSKSLEGAIDFYAPDRLVLDTRVRAS